MESNLVITRGETELFEVLFSPENSPHGQPNKAKDMEERSPRLEIIVVIVMVDHEHEQKAQYRQVGRGEDELQQRKLHSSQRRRRSCEVSTISWSQYS